MHRFAVVFLCLNFLAAARACDLCAVYSAVHAQGLGASAWTATVATQFTHFGTLRFDGTEAPNDTGQRLDSTITQLVVGRGISERFALQASVPFIDRSYQRPEGGAIESGRVRGWGDAAILGRFELLRQERAQTTVLWEVIAGVKLPTGSTGRLAEELEEPGHHDRIPMSDHPAPAAQADSPSGIHGHDLAPGTGSVDALMGSHLYVRWQRLMLTAMVQYAARQRGDYHYRYANDLTWEIAPGAYLLLGHQHTLAVQAVAAAERKALDDLAGEPADDTGIAAVYLGPRITYTYGMRLAASLGAEFPRRMRTTALQLTADYRVRGNLSWNF